MKLIVRSSLLILAVLLVSLPAAAQSVSLRDNAALRYWSAFSALQDSAITDQQARELNAILQGTAPYDDSQYQELLEKNMLALEIMARGTVLSNCDWGLDYGAEDVPGEYARKALVLGRLNVLYVFHLFLTGDKERGVRVLEAGLRFSHDVANGGSLFAALIAKDLLVHHLRAATDALHREQLTSRQRARLQEAVARLGPGLDWRTAAKLDLEGLRNPYAADPVASAALTRIISAYLVVLEDPAKMATLNEAMRSAPRQLQEVIPNPARVVEQEQELNNKLQQARSLLR